VRRQEVTDGRFSLSKMVKVVSSGSKGFASAEEATLDMERFYAAAMPGSVPAWHAARHGPAHYPAFVENTQ